jgi:NAD(P)-dependent dehydrogenase (short-subunit alcohol dehydrogenase family)
MAGWLAGKVTLVTGGASGIGQATALAVAREGAPVVIADVDVAGGEETGHLITTKGGEARFVRADVPQAADGRGPDWQGCSGLWVARLCL